MPTIPLPGAGVIRSLQVGSSQGSAMGGEARAALDIATGLLEAGHPVSLVATHGEADDVHHLSGECPELDVRLFPRRFPRHYFRSPALRTWLTSNIAHYDVVDVHSVFSFIAIYAARAATRAGVPYVIHPHGQLDPYDLQKHRLAKQIYGRVVVRPMLRHASRVVVTAEAEGERLERYRSHTPSSVASLPVIAPVETGDGARARERYGIPLDAEVVLFLGRFDPKKGLAFLIPALSRLKAERPNLWFVLAGAGTAAETAAVDKLLATSDISTWTTRPGFVSGPEKQDILAASDVFALPSLFENFGIAVVEALYAGVPVVVSSEVFIHETISSEGVGVVCTPDADDCVRAIGEILRDPARRDAMVGRASAVAAAHFAQGSATERLVRIYREVVGADSSNPSRP